MKKFLLLIICLLFITGCADKKDKKLEDVPDNKIENQVVLPPEPVYTDDNPVIIGLYQNGRLVKEISAPIRDNLDIGSFDVYFTNEENAGGTNTKRNFNKYAASYEDASKYKIGFYLNFETTDKKMEATILDPKGTYSLEPFVYCYLYDDVNQADGTWYDHVRPDDVKENTIYSSIKLYGAFDTNKITSPITLTVFTYDTEDDFDENGMYRGNSKYSITINRQ